MGLVSNYFREGNEEPSLTPENTIFPTAEGRACYPTHIPQSHGFSDVVPCHFMCASVLHNNFSANAISTRADYILPMRIGFHSQYEAHTVTGNPDTFDAVSDSLYAYF
jgi:hypothetical protein